METISETCICGAKFKVESNSSITLQRRYDDFLNAHAVCRHTQKPKLIYIRGDKIVTEQEAAAIDEKSPIDDDSGRGFWARHVYPTLEYINFRCGAGEKGKPETEGEI